MKKLYQLNLLKNILVTNNVFCFYENNVKDNINTKLKKKIKNIMADFFNYFKRYRYLVLAITYIGSTEAYYAYAPFGYSPLCPVSNMFIWDNLLNDHLVNIHSGIVESKHGIDENGEIPDNYIKFDGNDPISQILETFYYPFHIFDDPHINTGNNDSLYSTSTINSDTPTIPKELKISQPIYKKTEFIIGAILLFSIVFFIK